MEAESVSDTQLTPRESDILHLLAAGRQNAEIAAILCLSENTVESHNRRLFRKLGVHTRL